LGFVFAAVASAAEQKDEVVAIWNNEPIYRSEVEEKIAFKLYRLRGSIFRIIQRETEAIVDQRLLKVQAARVGLSVDELLEKEVSAKVMPPTKQEVSAYLDKHPKEGIATNQRRNRARTYLHQRALLQRRLDYLASLRANANFKFVLTQPQMPRTKIEIKGKPWRGSSQAPVTLVHFADLTSKLCNQSAQKIEKAMTEFPGKIKWVHRSFLNRMDESALAAALAGEQAHDLGKFWLYHDVIFRLNGDVDIDDLGRIAEDLGLKMNASKDIQHEGRYLLNIKKDMDGVKRMGVKAAPVIFVNGIYFSGTFSYEQLKTLIQAELGREEKRVEGVKTD
jgi:protein-disulfide isomerase